MDLLCHGCCVVLIVDTVIQNLQANFCKQPSVGTIHMVFDVLELFIYFFEVVIKYTPSWYVSSHICFKCGALRADPA